MTRMAEVEMVVVGGVRYRREHAPTQVEAEEVEAKAVEPANKSRQPRNKSAE